VSDDPKKKTHHSEEEERKEKAENFLRGVRMLPYL